MSRARTNADTTSRYDAKGDLISASADNTPAKVTVGSNNTLLVADSAQTAGVKWSASLSGLTLTSPTINSPTETSPLVVGPLETVTIAATAATGTVNFDAKTQAVLYYTTNASANWTLNVRGDSSTTLNTLLATGQSITVAFLVTQGATAYYQSAFQVDGSSVTPKWQGGSAPTAGNASAVDCYTVTVVKTGSAAFTAFSSLVQFK